MLQEMSKRRKLDEELSEPVVDREGVINQEIANIKPITRCSINFLSTIQHIFKSSLIQGHASDSDLY